jgi:hypothetical protein
VDFLRSASGVALSASTVRRLLAQARVLSKKRSLLGASERDEFLRCAWRAEVSERLAAERFVFVDEMGSNTSLSPLYGWSRVGERLRVKAPRNWGKNVTLLSSMSMEGMGPSVAVAGATTRAVFEASTSSRRSPRACAPGRWWSWTTSLPTREGG